ncbi:MAG TPA: GDP-mannose 4,6-dehydratase [Solirubrobacteraceae bacterium]|nr:GDP-mannose 4,6-dehydratase [Solirubrobacteraceae bacterium]
MTTERRRALITGLTGQDGSFLAESLLADGYEVVGVVHADAGADLGLAEPLRDRVSLIAGDLLVPASLRTAVAEARPHELFHLAAPTFVPESWRHPAHTMSAIVLATAALLEAVRDMSPDTRVLVAGSGEMYGDALECPQREDTPCRPRTPYAVAKLAAHQLVGQMREHDGLFACSAIPFNHESERRPENFVTRKITRTVAAIRLGLADELTLGDTGAVRDWSFAGDIMAGCRLMLAAETPRDYVLASGVGHTVQELLETAFAHVGLDPAGYVRTDPSLVRAPEAIPPIGDAGRARAELGWEPTLSFEQLVARMVDADLRELGATPNG